MSVGPISTNPKSFLSDDADWMKTRQAEWRLVLHRVRASEFELNREQLRKLKSYFFTGSPCPLEHDYLPTYPLSMLAVWWFNPEEPDPKYFEFPVNSRTDLDSSRGALLSTYFALVREAKKEGAGRDEYGGMGGRELPMMRALNPGVDRKKPHKLGGYYSGDLKRGGECLPPARVFARCVIDTTLELKSEDYVAFSPGIVLWDHLDYAMEHYELHFYCHYIDQHNITSFEGHPQLLNNVIRMNGELGDLLEALLGFFDRDPTDAARQRPRTVALVKELTERFERRNFCDNLMAHWDAAKQRMGKA